MRTAIIVGSSRKDGDTHALVQQINALTQWDIFYLNDYDISYYDYEHANSNDDYLPLMQRLLDHYDTFILATPVYWYSMSGLMKVFFDRLTDLLKIEKDTGRRLRGKNMAVVSSSNGGNLGEAFWLPFRESANYLGMHYLGNQHTYCTQDNHALVADFIASLRQSYE
jgi:multimeric flavodoxin WrbA